MKPYRLQPLLLVPLVTLLCACSANHYSSRDSNRDSAPPHPVDVSHIPDAIPQVETPSRYGNPNTYTVFGKNYSPMKTSLGFTQRGMASWYGTKFHGRSTSSGEPYDMYKMTAAHKTLPLPTYVEVTNVQNGRRVIVKVNDRGPFHGNRIIDLSYAAATKIGIVGQGTGEVKIRAIDPRTHDLTRASRAIRPAAPTAIAVQQPIATPAATIPSVDTTQARPGTPALFLQVGAFTQRDNAERLQQKIQQNAPGQVQISTINGLDGPVYRVRIGPLASVEEADRLAQSLDDNRIGTARVVTD